MSFRTPLRRLGFAALTAAAAALSSACSDDPADPIVRLDSQPGTAGNGPGDPPGDLCAPCDSRTDCAPGDVCVELERGGDHFCSRTCGDSHRCPTDYVCTDVYNQSSSACVPQSGVCMAVIP